MQRLTWEQVCSVWSLDSSKCKHMVRCPLHNDDKASLCLRYLNGTVLVHCFAGCANIDILRWLRQQGPGTQAPAVKARVTRRVSMLANTLVPIAAHDVYTQADILARSLGLHRSYLGLCAAMRCGYIWQGIIWGVESWIVTDKSTGQAQAYPKSAGHYPAGNKKYTFPGTNCHRPMYLSANIHTRLPVVITEGITDWLAAVCAIPKANPICMLGATQRLDDDSINALSTIAQAGLLYCAYDNDDPGDKGADYMRITCGAKRLRLPSKYKDLRDYIVGEEMHGWSVVKQQLGII